MNKFRRFILNFSLLAVLLTACAPSAVASHPGPEHRLHPSLRNRLRLLSTHRNTHPNRTPIPPPTAVRTPPTLPSIFTASQLNPLDVPHTYIQDTCEYLHNRWNSNNATPGTIVMVVMLHGIKREAADVTANDITCRGFQKDDERPERTGL